ncbi:prolyl-tRNA synthetase associated domain-containing protein 1-like [Dreissena polymorpha]|uniref:PrdX deacylase domain-containing protein 1 n=1 Tax=Dreissena polymorpha TaxID=45954 RepID=A0A9D4KW49_DREPO|nr:prolyl-tRNA synthetase associated domain-containing protein 1-like [Dreissena polymorpha]KAH3846297.1 hypothetical protein DPMN_088597 [Dreissena polymorpha]
MTMAGNLVDRKGLENQLRQWGIDFDTFEHPEVFTVEAALPHLKDVEGMFAKNLFLRDKKKRLFLFCAAHDADIKLNDLAKLVGASGGLRFADESVLQDKLGLSQGAVTVFGIINDVIHDVKLVLDSRLVDGSYARVLFHPMVNSATLSLTSTGLLKFVEKTGKTPLVINVST